MQQATIRRSRLAKYKLHFPHSWIVGLLAFSLFLMPFSSGASAGSVVIAFGLPALALAILCILLYFATTGLRFGRGFIVPIMVMGAVLYFVIAYTVTAPNLVASASRATVHALGFIVFLYLLRLHRIEPVTRTIIYRRVANALFLSGIVLALYFLSVVTLASLQFGLGEVLLSRSLGGLMSLPWGASNVIAGALLMPLFTGLARHSPSHRGIRRHAKWLGIGLILLAIVTSQSRGAIFALFASLLAIMFAQRSLKPILLGAGLLGIIIGTVVIFAPDLITGALSFRLGAANDQITLNGRTDIWAEFLSRFAQQPLTPIGYYGSLYIFEATGHNLLITTLLEQGVLGVLAILAVYSVASLWSWKGSRSSIPATRHACTYYFAGVVALFVSAQMEDPNFTQIFIVYSYIFFGLLYLVPFVGFSRSIETKPVSANYIDRVSYAASQS